jgi:hypothetical protein
MWSPGDYNYIIMISIVFSSLLLFGYFGVTKALKRSIKDDLWDDKNK